ncbi:hypothetical protein EC973_004939 [Apophysomyces ossiformis]|uniref:SEC7 domain-containing protein n=1 Tax=Apophysomyces ossiformis TaxID=679940 RepID=A0A8H7BHS7_9FUNG|nr:hypothetical protein EC973_004939 [Apophysomyces ossiformis]
MSYQRSGNQKIDNDSDAGPSFGGSTLNNKEVQAAFEQLTKSKSTRQNKTEEKYHVSEGHHIPAYLSSSSGSNNSFTQKLIDRGIAVPSSISHWKATSNTDQAFSSSAESHLSSSAGSIGNECDSTAYYGLSPFVTSSSFLLTTEAGNHFSMDPSIGGSRFRHVTRQHPYEKGSAHATQRLSHASEEEEDYQVMSSPELTKSNQYRIRRTQTDREDSDIELSDDDLEDPSKQATTGSSNFLTTTTPFVIRSASTRRRYQENNLKKRSPSPLAHALTSTMERNGSEEELQSAMQAISNMSPSHQPLNAKTITTFCQTSSGRAPESEPLENVEDVENNDDKIGDIRPVGHKDNSLYPLPKRKNYGTDMFSDIENRSYDSVNSRKREGGSTNEMPKDTQHEQSAQSFKILKELLTSKQPSSPNHAFSTAKQMGSQDNDWSPRSQLTKEHAVTEPAPLRKAPRRHLLQTPVFQVVNANTVKDRYLFLFSDLLLICKPIMDENIIVGGTVSGNREHSYRFRPNENSLFQVKNIVELSKITLYMSREEQQLQQQQHRPSIIISSNGRSMISAPRKMHPVLASALRKFETSAENGISYLVDKQVLTNDPLSIANFLFKTPDLNRRQLGQYLANPRNRDVYDAFLDCFRLVGFRLDEALRILLTTFRLPSNWESLEYIIERFAKKWHDANQNVVKFHEDMVVKVIVAMLFLNAEVWYEASSERDVFWSARERKERKDRERMMRRGSMDRKANRESVAIEPLHYISALRAKGTMKLSMNDFLDRWNHFDQYTLVPREFMEDMYRSIIGERLETGWDNRAGRISPAQDSVTDSLEQTDKDVIITVTPYRLPTRLTKGVPSAPITISIPSPDPGLQIKLRGQDLICEPNVLDFSKSCAQTFTIVGHTLGRTSLMFIKSGEHAGHYVSPTLPRTKSIVVERPFMRYTFQISFSHTDIRAVKAAAAAAMTGGKAVHNCADYENVAVKSPSDASSPVILSNADIRAHDDGGEATVSIAQQEPPAMVKRKYTFSVETEEERREWVEHLKSLSGNVCIGNEVSKERQPEPEKDRSSAEERVALQVLKEVLLADEVKKGTANVAALRSTILGSRSSVFDPQQKSTVSLPLSTKTMDDANQEENGEKKKLEDTKGGDRTSLRSVAAGTTNVVTKRGHEIIKLVVQNSMVPLMLGFLRNQIKD